MADKQEFGIGLIGLGIGQQHHRCQFRDFDSVLATIDINMPPLQGLGLCLETLL